MGQSQVASAPGFKQGNINPTNQLSQRHRARTICSVSKLTTKTEIQGNPERQKHTRETTKSGVSWVTKEI